MTSRAQLHRPGLAARSAAAGQPHRLRPAGNGHKVPDQAGPGDVATPTCARRSGPGLCRRPGRWLPRDERGLSRASAEDRTTCAQAPSSSANRPRRTHRSYPPSPATAITLRTVGFGAARHARLGARRARRNGRSGICSGGLAFCAARICAPIGCSVSCREWRIANRAAGSCVARRTAACADRDHCDSRRGEQGRQRRQGERQCDASPAEDPAGCRDLRRRKS